ncbi:hypothetical protein AB0L88_14485 [Saccharopolyspora shandongensis]|uniref:Uncharacterized protein n=1 Tax=Saccharopolyspora shandongensis TaxID=418495 RepID=A0A1H3DFG7_9PSEU|nr:hypothetical protein [Saccharopolyspora shandongensis]SDX65097.1 hypothetical protein SAMN05216215_101387 [Saccharopolyspora shandongensis]
MYRGRGVETATLVGISEMVDVSHEYDECSDEVTLIFRGNDELVLSCTRRGFAVLRDAVADANRDLITRAV